MLTVRDCEILITANIVDQAGDEVLRQEVVAVAEA